MYVKKVQGWGVECEKTRGCAAFFTRKFVPERHKFVRWQTQIGGLRRPVA